MYDELIKRLRNWPRVCVQYDGSVDQLHDEAADAIEELTDTNVGKWIPVTEQLPKGADKSGELCENVWLFFDDGNVYPGWMNGITEKVYYLDNYSGSLMTAPISRVKMWQPRPQPPKEE